MYIHDSEKHIFVAVFQPLWRPLFGFSVYAFSYSIWCHYHPEYVHSLPFSAIGTTGTVLAMLTAFRFQIAYNRWLDGLVLWQKTEAECYSLARMTHSFACSNTHPTTCLQDFINTLMAFPYALHNLLIQHPQKNDPVEPPQEHIKQLLPQGYNLDSGPKPLPLAIPKLLSHHIDQLQKINVIDGNQAVILHDKLTQFESIVAECQRIKHSPLPKRYQHLFYGLIYFFTLSLPWFLIQTLGWFTPFFTAMNFLVFMTLDSLGHRTEIPFGTRRHDITGDTYAHRIALVLKTYQ